MPLVFSCTIHLLPKLVNSFQLPIYSNMLTNVFLFHCINLPWLQAHFHDLHVMENLGVISKKSNVEFSNNNNISSSSSMAIPSIIYDFKDALE